MLRRLLYPIPVYVTRKTADGDIAVWTVGAVFGVIAITLILANVIAWGLIGLYEAVRVVAG